MAVEFLAMLQMLEEYGGCLENPILYDHLAKTEIDVDLLVEKKVLDNWLGRDEAVVNLINKLCHQIVEASAAQLGWAISSFKRGHVSDSHFMPFKAFSVASLFLGATSTAAVSVLHVSGIHKVEDLLEVGTNIRTGLGVRPRALDE
nr:hypothetical protein CFP56_73175 [Quercus suber]